MTKSTTPIRGESSSRDEDFIPDPAMKAEIEAAVGFLTDFLVKAPKLEFSSESVDLFRRSLQSVLYRHYQGHWHSAHPLRGSGFRCLRINGKLDPLVTLAAEASRLPLRKVRQAFPAELTVWVDPGDVSVRFGEEGSVGVWYASRRAVDDEDRQQKSRSTEDHLTHQAFQRNSPTLSSTPPGVQTAAFSQHQTSGYARSHYQGPAIQYPRQQSSPIWAPQWQQQTAYSPNRSSPSSFVTTASNNGFAMALNHQQQQMQLRQNQHTPTRYTTVSSSPSSRVSPQPTPAMAESTSMENGEEQRCKMLAERLMREKIENLNLMASLAPGLVSSRPQAVGVGVN